MQVKVGLCGRLRSEKLNKYAKWIAWWYQKADFDKSIYPIWQYSSKGKIDGINGYVDMNESFVDFPKQLKYLQMIVKIQQIKMMTGLADITLQYLNCYKWNDDLMIKLFNRLQKGKIIVGDEWQKNKWKLIQKEFELGDNTIQFMQFYLYVDDLRDKLFDSIIES